MAFDPIESASLFTRQVERCYSGLISAARLDSNSEQEPNLGGKLFYVGELDANARALLVAANIAGAASLAVSSDETARKQAFRDGVVDFLVTSLDEALRILKNELRKRQTVAVCVAATPDVPETEFVRAMRLRGIKPDLALPIEQFLPRPDQLLLAWRVASSPANWLPKLDAIALHCLNEYMGAPGLDFETRDYRRWLRLAPRYLGRLAQETRLLRGNAEFATRFRDHIEERVEQGEIGVAVEFMLTRVGQPEFEFFSSSGN